MCSIFALREVLIAAVFICAVIAVIRILVGQASGAPAWVIALLNVVLWVVVALVAIWLIFGLLTCVPGLR